MDTISRGKEDTKEPTKPSKNLLGFFFKKLKNRENKGEKQIFFLAGLDGVQKNK
jgi:hypothetical protein